MREHQQIDPTDPEIVEAAPQRLGLRSGVDERDDVTRSDQDGVTLPDVARRVLPVGRARGEFRDPDAADAREVGDDRDGGDCSSHAAASVRAGAARPRSPSAVTADQQRRSRAHRPATDSGLPATPRRIRDRRDPAGGHPRDRRERGSETRDHREHEAGNQPENRRERRGRCGEDVRRHPVERQRRIQHQQHGLAGELRSDRHGEHEGEASRQHATERGGQRPGEHEQPGGREHRQREAVVEGEPGIDDEQPDHREAEHGQPAQGATERQREQHHCRHHAGAQDARLRGDEHDEPGERHERRRDPDARVARRTRRRAPTRCRPRPRSWHRTPRSGG